MRVITGGVAVLATALVATAYGSVNGSKPGAYSLVARQAQDVAVSMRFVNAFNAHSLSQTLATFSPNAFGSDCDYRRIQVVTFTGRRQIAAWLRRRFADDDHLRVARMLNENPSQPVGVLAVDWTRRTSRTYSIERSCAPDGSTGVSS